MPRLLKALLPLSKAERLEVERWIPLAKGIIYRMCAPYEREERLQDMTFAITRAIRSYHPRDAESTLRTWIAYIIKKSILDERRTRTGIRNTYQAIVIPLGKYDHPGIDEITIAMDRLDANTEYLRILALCTNAAERKLLGQRHDGMSLKDIGKSLGVSEARACQLFKKLRLKIVAGS